MSEKQQEEIINAPAYIVLELPSPVADKIRAFRAKFDAGRAWMPAEITVTGSSGTGLLSCGQSFSTIRKFVNAVAAELEPFPARFKGIDRFPNTDIYFLTLEDETPFRKVNTVLSRSGLLFEKNPFPYRAHCTLKLRCPPQDMDELVELFTLHVPQETFLIHTLSVYMLTDQENCDLVHMTELGKRP